MYQYEIYNKILKKEAILAVHINSNFENTVSLSVVLLLYCWFNTPTSSVSCLCASIAASPAYNVNSFSIRHSFPIRIFPLTNYS